MAGIELTSLDVNVRAGGRSRYRHQVAFTQLPGHGLERVDEQIEKDLPQSTAVGHDAKASRLG